MTRIDALTVDDLVAFSAAFDELAGASATMEEAGDHLVRHLRQLLRGPDDEVACALVRLYKTHRYRDLPPDLRAFADDVAGAPLDDETRCLTLLATAGLLPQWNDRRRSANHQAIPLMSEAVVEESPMIAALVRELGLEVTDVVAAIRPELHHQRQGVFYVPEAAGSPAVPAQADFVIPYGIRSVVGCGGVLPNGDMFALVLFTVVAVPEEAADLFRSIALSIKANLVPFTFKVF